MSAASRTRGAFCPRLFVRLGWSGSTGAPHHPDVRPAYGKAPTGWSGLRVARARRLLRRNAERRCSNPRRSVGVARPHASQTPFGLPSVVAGKRDPYNRDACQRGDDHHATGKVQDEARDAAKAPQSDEPHTANERPLQHVPIVTVDCPSGHHPVVPVPAGRSGQIAGGRSPFDTRPQVVSTQQRFDQAADCGRPAIQAAPQEA